MKRLLISKIKKSPFVEIQMDESTNVANLSQLLGFVRYIHKEKIEEYSQFFQPLETSAKAGDVMQLLSSIFEERNLNWDCLVGVCTDGELAILSSFQQKNPLDQSTHSVLHREALTSKLFQDPFVMTCRS